MGRDSGAGWPSAQPVASYFRQHYKLLQFTSNPAAALLDSAKKIVVERMNAQRMNSQR